SSLKKMPHSRARRCSLSAAVASLVMSSRSQRASPEVPLSSLIFESREKDHAAALRDAKLYERCPVAGPAEASSARRIISGTVRRAYQIESRRIEKYSFLPVQF